jgi:hypothetical protein
MGEIQRKTKAAPDNLPPEAQNPTPGEDPAQYDTEHDDVDNSPNAEEPVGMQVLRRIHQDHMILMEDYDEMMKPLENEAVKQHLQEQLQRCEEVLSATEKLFASEYKDAEKGLDGADTGEEEGEGEEEEREEPEEGEEEEVETDSDDRSEGEPSPEEAAEASHDKPKMKDDEKGLPRKTDRLNRRQGTARSSAQATHHAQRHGERADRPRSYSQHGQAAARKEKGMDNMEEGDVNYGNVKNLRRKYRKGYAGEEVGDEHAQKKPGHGGSSEGVEGSHKPGEEAGKPKPGSGRDEITDEGEHTPGEEAGKPKPGDPLAAHEKGYVGEAHKFLKEVSESPELTQQHRMDAWHYHKTLDPIGMVTAAASVGGEVGGVGEGGGQKGMGKGACPECGNSPCTCRKAMPGKTGAVRTGSSRYNQVELASTKKDFEEADEMDEAVNVNEPGEKGIHPHRMAVGAAASFMKELAQTPDFTDDHRKQAFHHHKALDGAISEAQVQTPDGAMEMKHLEDLKTVFLEQQKTIAGIASRINLKLEKLSV